MSVGLQIIQIFSLIWKIILYGSPFWLLVLVFVWKKTWGRYPLEAVIIEKRGENLVKTNDRIGKHVDRFSGLISYKFHKCKDTIPVYNFDWVMHNVIKNTNILEKLINIIRLNMGTIFLFRYGSKQYKPINIIPNKKDGKLQLTAIKDDRGNPIYVNQYSQFDPRGMIGALDFEVVDWDNINFMVQEQRATNERRKSRNDFLKMIALPIAALIVTFLICLFMMKFSVDWSKDVRGAAPPPNTPGGGSIIGGALDNAITPGT